MKRDLPAIYGTEGEFYVESKNNMGQDREDNIIDYNEPPSTQPGLWLQWIPTDDGTALHWDEGEKFYEYIDWMKYLIKKILAPNRYVLNGTIKWQGEEIQDRGNIHVKNNKVIIEELE